MAKEKRGFAFVRTSPARNNLTTNTVTKNTDPLKLDASNLGDSAIYTDSIGNSQSVKITTVLPNDVRISWAAAPRCVHSRWVPRAQWGSLVLFPAGAMFLAV